MAPLDERQVQAAYEEARLREQLQGLQQRLQELEHEETLPQRVLRRVPRMCPLCKSMMGGWAMAEASEEERELRAEIRCVEERLEALAGQQSAHAATLDPPSR